MFGFPGCTKKREKRRNQGYEKRKWKKSILRVDAWSAHLSSTSLCVFSFFTDGLKWYWHNVNVKAVHNKRG